MIIASLHCQMGNQMFQYAFARTLSQRSHQLCLTFQSNSGYPFKLGYFELDGFTDFVYSHPVITKQYHRVCRKLVNCIYVNEVSDNEGFDRVSLRPTNAAYYNGFFQSEDYFTDYASEIKKAFLIKRRYLNLFNEKYGLLFENNKILVVHVRRTDYTQVEFPGMGGIDVSLPVEYYKKALSSIKEIGKYQILFVSDDIESVRRDFKDVPNAHFEENSSIVDFQIIQHADIAIISNSTFAWWAAWLNEKPGKRVLAPKYWLGHKVKQTFPVGIETKKFEWIEY